MALPVETQAHCLNISLRYLGSRGNFYFHQVGDPTTDGTEKVGMRM